MERDIVIYNDEGVGEFGLRCLQKFFKDDEVWLCNADAVIDGRILEMADIFVMPGGADLPYCKKLNGEGNENIRSFVETGGTYLGICAGAYYACREIEFHKGRPDAICEPRELSFVEAVAIGSLPDLAPHYDLTLHSASVITLKNSASPVLYHGGPYFKLMQGEEVDILAEYDLPVFAPAIIRKQVGEGTVILSGIHGEATPDLLREYPAKSEDERLKARQLADRLKPDSATDFAHILFGTRK